MLLTRTSRNRAFTLVELLTVVAIIVVLLGLLVTGINKGFGATLKAKCSSNLHQLGTAILAYADSNTAAIPLVSNPSSGNGNSYTKNEAAGYFFEDSSPGDATFAGPTAAIGRYSS